jgi:hypothetical protein
MTPAKGTEYLDKLPPDEPVFILRARDMYAPSTVASWSAVVGSVRSLDEQVVFKAKSKARGALELSEEMRQWQMKNSSKVPD